jgi:membrane-associated phospholipid phosphatase
LAALLLLFIGLLLRDRSWDGQFFTWFNSTLPLALPAALLPLWDGSMISLTTLGDTHVMLWIILLIFLPSLMAKGEKSSDTRLLYLAVLAIVLLLATLLSQGFKELLLALRPASVLPRESLRILGETLYNYSFPSGHTMTAFAGIATILPLLPSTWRRVALVLAAGIGLSRIGMGAHWPLDVTAGAFLGMLSGMAGWRGALWLAEKSRAGLKIWQNLYRGLAVASALTLAANVIYTPFYTLDNRAIRLGLIALCFGIALFVGYRQRTKLK